MLTNNLDPLLKHLEFTITDIAKKYDGKQSQRLFSSTVWMNDFIENKISSQINAIKKELEAFHNNTQDTIIQNNAMISVKHLEEVQKLLNEILFAYKNSDISQADQFWRKNLLPISEKMKSLRNRIDIITSSISKKKKIEDEDWYNNL